MPNTLMNRFCEQSHSKAFSSERTDTVVIKKSDKSFFMLLLVGWYRDYIVPSF